MGGSVSRERERLVVGDLPRHAAVVAVDAREENRTSSGTTTTVSHAPSANFETDDDDERDARRDRAQRVDRHSDARAPCPPRRRQCCTMPACESVNARNAPMAKSGISRR